MKENKQILSMSSDVAVIVLAAGQGVRMKSTLSKVLHPIFGKSMVLRTIEIIKKINPGQIILVANPQNANTLKKLFRNFSVVIQPHSKGTADATKYGLKYVREKIRTITVIYGDDSAFYKPQTIIDVYQHHLKSGAKITFVTVKKTKPTGLGRIIRKNGKAIGIVEEKDATPQEKLINEVNDGLYFFKKDWLASNLSKILPSPPSGEYYITDLIGLAFSQKEKVTTYQLANDSQWHGINTRKELLQATEKFQKRIHIMGIAGAGASATAGIAKGYGFQVSGCDLKTDSAYIQNLKGIDIEKGHNLSHLVSIGHLIISPAVLAFNPQAAEIKQAKKENISIITWQEFQGRYLQKSKFVIAIAGAYGKSTTTAMISNILIDAGYDPTCEVGATVLSWGNNFQVGKSKYYVCEADEYRDNFLNYSADIAVILNIDWDHPDFFKSQKSVENSFKKFVRKIKNNGWLITTEQIRQKLKDSIPSNVNFARISDYQTDKLSIIGDFRKENVSAALTVAKLLNIDILKAKKSLSSFSGLGRRLEYKGEIAHVKVYDDYAVQPYTVLKTADALKKKFANRSIVLVFEPHTFSRISTFFKLFVKNLKKTTVDAIYITNVYPAREKGNPKILAQKLTAAIGPKAQFTGTIEQTAAKIRSNSHNFEIILGMGAGDIYKLWDYLDKNGHTTN